MRNSACPCIAISHPSALNGVQKWHVFNMLQISRFSKPFFHFVSDGRQHDFHKFSVVCEMTVSVMFLRQLLGDKKHEFRKLVKYVMFSIIICAHVSETILCAVFGGSRHFGAYIVVQQTWRADSDRKTTKPPGRASAHHGVPYIKFCYPACKPGKHKSHIINYHPAAAAGAIRALQAFIHTFVAHKQQNRSLTPSFIQFHTAPPTHCLCLNKQQYPGASPPN